MIFLTVGTQFPFDRLVKAVDDAVGAGLVREEVFAQTGRGRYKPLNMRWKESLDREEFRETVRGARALIGHAGIGTILTALDLGKPLLVMPRLHRHNEVVNDHQVATARQFATLGHILAAYAPEDIPRLIAALETFSPAPRVAVRDKVVGRVKSYLDGLAGQDAAPVSDRSLWSWLERLWTI